MANDDESIFTKVLEGAGFSIGCVLAGLFHLVVTAIPIAIAILIVIWVLRACS